MNHLAMEVLFEQPGAHKLGTIPAAYDSNPDNYDPHGNLWEGHVPAALALDLYDGLRVRLTRNLAKHLDYVNGMSAVIQSYDRKTGVVHLPDHRCRAPMRQSDVLPLEARL